MNTRVVELFETADRLLELAQNAEELAHSHEPWYYEREMLETIARRLRDKHIHVSNQARSIGEGLNAGIPTPVGDGKTWWEELPF